MRWSVVLPVYNEIGFLPEALRSLCGQSVRFHLIVVDNGSTDGCIDNARELLAAHDGPATILSQPTPGQVHALKLGIEAVATELVAICDADTFYPPHYLERAEALFDARGSACVATAACLRTRAAEPLDANSARQLVAASLLPRQNHTSGAAHAFRTETLRAAGSYDPALWPYVVKDHELLHRVLKLGDVAWDRRLWCSTSGRRRDRRGVRWTLGERIAYHLTPFAAKDWFFYRFLGPRFEARRQRDTVLRQRSWDAPAPGGARGLARAPAQGRAA